MPDTTDPRVISYLALRRIVGGIAIFLPLSLIFWGVLFSTGVEETISQFYYTDMRNIFVGCLLVVGTFLLAYTGYDKADDEWVSDRFLTLLAGSSVIMVALVPTDAKTVETTTLRASIHLVAAGVFLLSIGLISYFKFARCYNPFFKRIFKTLGAITLFSLAIMVIIVLVQKDDSASGTWIFWLESIAVWAFGAAWLIKGKTTQGIRHLQRRLLGQNS